MKNRIFFVAATIVVMTIILCTENNYQSSNTLLAQKLQQDTTFSKRTKKNLAKPGFEHPKHRYDSTGYIKPESKSPNDDDGKVRIPR